MNKLLLVVFVFCASYYVTAAGSVPSNQRTGFHFQPEKNWMNDPNGPLFYKGMYHLFYQYNPYSAAWGNITWGHAVSKDLVRWAYLQPALVPDRWYDVNGVWSGSATMVKGKPVLVYTGATNESVQAQSKAYAVDYSDKLLRHWVKADQDNPMMVAPAGVKVSDFRDPITAWRGIDGSWIMGLGAKKAGETGQILQYRSSDFSNWELLEQPLHSARGTGMWECPDFYPVWIHGRNGVPNEQHPLGIEKGLRYVVKASTQGSDVYVVGRYDREEGKFVPSSGAVDIGTPEANLYDHGIYYASKTFYDPLKNRRIVWGWIREDDAPENDISKGWASVQALPRQIWLDETNPHCLMIYPVEEVKSLRKNYTSFGHVNMNGHSSVEANVSQGSQLDVEVMFDLSPLGIQLNSSALTSQEALNVCSGAIPAEAEEVVGPFGVKVLVSEDLQEQTNIFFKLVYLKTSGWQAVVCNDLSRSSLSPDARKEVYASALKGLTSVYELKLRIIVDHSIVETFAQDGKAAITARVYPQLLDQDQTARLFVFNDAEKSIRLNRATVWEMKKLQFPELS